ncbi:MAG: rod shape-determining protein [Clostridia bacterium]|nr:rod shape-determining protein [Clostridia bacterium]
MIRIAIDLGTSMTKIFRADAGNGLVLAEPSCVAVSGSEREIRAIGKEAKKLVGKTAEFTEIVFPVYEGEIVDGRLAAVMLKKFLERVGVTAATLRRTEAVFSVPCGADAAIKADYAALAEECGLKKVRFVETPFLAALGSDAVLSESSPVFTIDIGGGVTNIAAVSLCGVIAGLSMNIGGNNMDANIIARIEQFKGLRIGALTAERVKNEIGSLSPVARGTTVAEGSSVSTLRPSSVSVQAAEIVDCLRVYVDKIVEYASLILRKLPAEVAAEVNRSGVYLSGGVAKLSGVAEYVSKRLEMRTHVSDEPQFAVIMGAGTLARDKRLLALLSPDGE